MQGLGVIATMVLVGGVVLSAILVIWIVDRIAHMSTRPITASPAINDTPTAFLFEGAEVIDATPQARRILDAAAGPCKTRAEVAALLDPQFPGLRERLASDMPDLAPLPAKTRIGGHLEFEQFGNSLRMTVHLPKHKFELHPLAYGAMTAELDTLRHIGEASPQLIWKLDAQGTVAWANSAYLDVVDATIEAASETAPNAWPPMNLFEIVDSTLFGPHPETIRRQVFQTGETLPRWYDVTSMSADGGSMHFAVDVGAVVKAEQQSKLFVQMLTKTFSDLSAGLAVFDKNRRLMTFNPALVHLTQLPAQFLAGQPTLTTMLDRLRDAGMLPEPKNYLQWRNHLLSLGPGDTETTYNDTWALPGGVTYRVTGRPHPNGALALLIEDISADISLTRRVKTELDGTQAILDSLDEAIAVFSTQGQLVHSNLAYQTHWSPEEAPPNDAQIAHEMQRWKSVCDPFDHWGALHKNLVSGDEARAGTFQLSLTDGRKVACRITALKGGHTLIGFQTAEIVQKTPAKTGAVSQV